MKELNNINYSFMGTFLRCKDDIYSFSREQNILFDIDRNNLALKSIDFLPNEDFSKRDLISEIKVWKNKLIFIPCNASSIYIKENNIYRTINLEKYVNKNLNNKFYGSVIYKDCLYMFGHWASIILGVDLNEEKIVFAYNVPEKFISMKNQKNDAYFSDYLLEGEKVYLPFLSEGYIAVLNLQTKDIQWIKVADETNGFSLILRYKQGVFILCRRNERGMVLYDEINNKVKSMFEKIDFRYGINISSVGFKVLVTCYDNCSYFFEIESGKYEVKNDKCFRVIIEGDELIKIKKEGIEILDLNNKNSRTFDIDYSNFNCLINEKRKEINACMNGIVQESTPFLLESFVKVV